jgi:hypothetical protein
MIDLAIRDHIIFSPKADVRYSDVSFSIFSKDSLFKEKQFDATYLQPRMLSTGTIDMYRVADPGIQTPQALRGISLSVQKCFSTWLPNSREKMQARNTFEALSLWWDSSRKIMTGCR